MKLIDGIINVSRKLIYFEFIASLSFISVIKFKAKYVLEPLASLKNTVITYYSCFDVIDVIRITSKQEVYCN